MTNHHDVFLSYSHNDPDAATQLLGQLEKAGLSVFRDQKSIRAGDLWLDRLQGAVEACGSFVVLVGHDGVRRWIGAETQVALSRHFSPHDDAKRLPISPVLLGDTDPEALPAFLRLFQGTRWSGTEPLPKTLLEQIRERKTVPGEIHFEGCPFVGLNAYKPEQAKLFFGRQKETLDALACFDPRPRNPDGPRQGDRGPTVRWLEINGNSGSGKSSLMNAGLLPLVDQGWLRPRTGFETWRRIGPMMPGVRPVEALAQALANAFVCEMADVYERLTRNEDGLRMWLRSRLQDQPAFLLAVDQFEELFTFADPGERGRFDRTVAAALEDPDCLLFVISTVRSDFLDRFDDLPRLVAVRNRLGKAWTLPLVSTQGLREIISGPAQLAGIDPSEVQEVMVAEAEGEPGALPLVENALYWLWDQGTQNGRLSGGLFTERGGLAGILTQIADDLLEGLGERRDQALELLFRLVKVDPEGRSHTRRRIPLAEGVALGGGGERGHDLVDRLAGVRARAGGRAQGPLQLITVGGGEGGATTADDSGQFRESTWVHGEDLDHPRHPMSFTLIEGDQIVLDNNTKLMWESDLNFRSKRVVPPKGEPMPQDVFYPKEIEPRRRPYHEAVQYCRQLRLGGYDDWRMPTTTEVHTIAHYAAAWPTIHMAYFKDVYPGLPGYGDRGKGGMWSGPIAPDHPNSGWHLGSIDGHLMGYPRSGYKTTRCVRADDNGAYWLPDLVDNGDGTVTDDVAKLMWVQDVPPDIWEWEEAIQYCEDLVLADHDDWKLPSNKELTSKVDYRKMKPALDEEIFPNTDYKACYWSRTNETRDAARNLMSETTVQPEDIDINNANENAFAQSNMLGANWRAPRRGFRVLARRVRWLH